MKLAPKSVDAFLAAPSREFKAALIFGVDNGLVRERCEKAVKAILGKDFSDPMAKVEFLAAQLTDDPARLSDELSAVSMMCPKRVIIIRDAGDKLTKIIEDAASCFHPDNFLIVLADELSSRSSLRLFFEKQKDCAALACYHDEARDIQAVIRQKFDAAGISYDRVIVDYLSENLGNDRYVTYQELEKLIVYAGEEKKIGLQDVIALVDYNEDINLDDIVNSVADKDIIALEKYVTQHLREGTQPIVYLRAIARYFNKIYSIHTQALETGQSIEMVIAGLRPQVFYKQVPILTKHANHWSIENIVKALKILIRAELACKTSVIPVVPVSSRELLKITQLR